VESWINHSKVSVFGPMSSMDIWW